MSNSKFETEQFRRAFWYQGRVLECGCPKNDVFFRDDSDSKNRVQNAFKLDAKTKIALYAPTFRSNYELHYYSIDYDLLRKALHTKFGGDWRVLVRLHPLLMNKAKDLIEYTDYIMNATEYSDMQDLLLCSDAYITDYSSPMFEFCMSRKPVFLFTTDYEEFMKDRGWYLDYFNMPFPAAQNNQELADNIKNFSQEEYEKKLKEFWNEIGLIENGTASKTVVEEIKKVMVEHYLHIFYMLLS